MCLCVLSMTSFNYFCGVRSLYFVDVQEILLLHLSNVDKLIMKHWSVLIFCWVLFSPGAPLFHYFFLRRNKPQAYKPFFIISIIIIISKNQKVLKLSINFKKCSNTKMKETTFSHSQTFGLQDCLEAIGIQMSSKCHYCQNKTVVADQMATFYLRRINAG